MHRGIVKWFNPRRGVGVIVPADDLAGAELVVLAPVGDALEHHLVAGQPVYYEVDLATPRVARLDPRRGPVG